MEAWATVREDGSVLLSLEGQPPLDAAGYLCHVAGPSGQFSATVKRDAFPPARVVFPDNFHPRVAQPASGEYISSWCVAGGGRREVIDSENFTLP